MDLFGLWYHAGKWEISYLNLYGSQNVGMLKALGYLFILPAQP